MRRRRKRHAFLRHAIEAPQITTVGNRKTEARQRPAKNILDNIAFVQQPMDEGLLSEILELLKPIHNFNFSRGRPEHRDPIRGMDQAEIRRSIP